MLNRLLDEYTIKALLAPALIATFPIGVLVAFAPENIFAKFAFPGIGLICISMAAAHMIRRRAHSVEDALLLKWGGYPTTRLLRNDSFGSSELRERRRADVERVSRVSLPSRRDELADSPHSNELYNDAVKTCIDRIRHGSESSRLLQSENIGYGFRRNLFAIKPAGITLNIIGIVATTILSLLSSHWATGLMIAFADLSFLAFWWFFVRESWLIDQADRYADRFFREIRALSLN